ncbi:histidine kinase, partial [Blautia wexlerae]
MELISNLFQFAVTLLGFCMSGIRYLKGRKQTYFLLTCFYGCFALGSLYWTLYLLLFSETPQVFYVSEFGWIASVIFLYLLQYTLSSAEERDFSTRKSLIAPLIGVPLCVFYCTFGDVLSNLLWCGMMIVVSYHSIRGLAYAQIQTGTACKMRYFHIGVL